MLILERRWRKKRIHDLTFRDCVKKFWMVWYVLATQNMIPTVKYGINSVFLQEQSKRKYVLYDSLKKLFV
jgi:hypothetical protein